jgi:hypothetical protein
MFFDLCFEVLILCSSRWMQKRKRRAGNAHSSDPALSIQVRQPKQEKPIAKS